MKTCIFAPLLLLGACATASPPGVTFYDGIGVGDIVAPEPYLSQGRALVLAGSMHVVLLPTSQLNNICHTSSAYTLGCAAGWTPSHTSCVIYFRDNLPAWYVDMATEVHEAAHCAGWAANHPGARDAMLAEIEAYQ